MVPNVFTFKGKERQKPERKSKKAHRRNFTTFCLFILTHPRSSGPNMHFLQKPGSQLGTAPIPPFSSQVPTNMACFR